MDNKNRASALAGKNFVTLQVLDDLSDTEKNMQAHNVHNPRDLVSLDDKVRQWDTDKAERIERAFRKLLKTYRLL